MPADTGPGRIIVRSPVGIVALGGYLPGKELPEPYLESFIRFLRTETLLHSDYIRMMELMGRLPGLRETETEDAQDDDGPRQSDATQRKRRRVPMDPDSLKRSPAPHPMHSSDAETLAGALAIFSAHINKSDVDLVLVSSLVPDRHAPLNAALVQHKLGLPRAGACNMDCCAASFVTMCEFAANLIASGTRRMALVVASSLDSHLDDRLACNGANAGDAAVAALIGPVEAEHGYVASHSSRPKGQTIVLQRGKRTVTRTPARTSELAGFLERDFSRVLEASTQSDIDCVVHEALAKAGLSHHDLQFLVTHQPAAWAPNAWRERIGLAKSQFLDTFHKYGNIACASIGVNLLEAIERGLVQAGDRVLLAAPGIGENHAAFIERISARLVASIRKAWSMGGAW